LLKGNQQRENEMQGTAIKLFYFISKREQYVTFNAMQAKAVLMMSTGPLAQGQ
jgi:hypothetical protein